MDELETAGSLENANAESAPANVATPDVQVPDAAGEHKPHRVEKRISTLVGKLSQKDQELAQVRAENAAIKASIESPKPTATIDLPSDDLRYEDPAEYRRQLSAYHASIASAEVQKSMREVEENRIRAQRDSERLAGEKRHQEIVSDYLDNALLAGISEEKLLANEYVLRSVNLEKALVEQIYADKNGAQVVNFLADNPEKLQEVAAMNPYQAAVFIANQVKPQALSSKPTQTNAPDPAPITTGGGVPPSDEWSALAPGATFE
jgi:hypothetical protein